MRTSEIVMAEGLKNNPKIHPVFAIGNRRGKQVYHLVHVYMDHEKALNRVRALWEKGKIAYTFATQHKAPGVPTYQASYGDFEAMTYNREAGWHKATVRRLPFYRSLRPKPEAGGEK